MVYCNGVMNYPGCRCILPHSQGSTAPLTRIKHFLKIGSFYIIIISISDPSTNLGNSDLSLMLAWRDTKLYVSEGLSSIST